MSAERPNYIHHHNGERNFGDSFGDLTSVTPVHFSGAGHHPHLEARFRGGWRFDFTPETIVELIRAAKDALAKLPALPDFSDATWRGDDL